MTQTATLDPAPEILICPACGYDLRAATTDRCSECGLVIDRQALHVSAFPWEHRKQIGRLRAFIKTVWQVALDSKKIRYEMARPQTARAGRRFRIVNSACVFVALLAVAWLALINPSRSPWQPQLEALAVQPPQYIGTPLPGYQQDLAVPWCAAMTRLLIPPMCLLGLAIFLTGASKEVLRSKKTSGEMQQRMRVIGTYAAGPLAAILLSAITWVMFYVLRVVVGFSTESDNVLFRFEPVIAVVANSCAALPLGATLLRTGQWKARVIHGGVGTILLGAGELLLRWLGGCLFFLGLLPWCIGLTWIAIDSFL